MLTDLRETLWKASMDLQPRTCQWLAMRSAAEDKALKGGEQAVPRVEQMTGLGTVISAQDSSRLGKVGGRKGRCSVVGNWGLFLEPDFSTV